VKTPDFLAFLLELRRLPRRPNLLVCDRLNAHRSAVRQLHEAGADWLSVEWLPPYAPDLNPVEAVWNQAKYSDLANRVPDDVFELCDLVDESLNEQHFRPPLLGPSSEPISSAGVNNRISHALASARGRPAAQVCFGVLGPGFGGGARLKRGVACPGCAVGHGTRRGHPARGMVLGWAQACFAYADFALGLAP